MSVWALARERAEQLFPECDEKQVVFLNSVDCLYYGYGFDYLNRYSLEGKTAREVWIKARDFLGNL